MQYSQRGHKVLTIWRMRFSSWITKVTNPHSEYVILIAFPQQQWLHERVCILRCTYIACVVMYFFQRRCVFQATPFFCIFSSKPSVCVCVCYREHDSIDVVTTMWAIGCYLITLTLQWPEYVEITIGSPRLVRLLSHFLYVHEVILLAWHTRTQFKGY